MTAAGIAGSLLHVGDPGSNRVLVALLLGGGLTSVVLVAIGTLALLRRRSRAYVLVVFALATFSAKAFVGGLALFGGVLIDGHHTVEHGLDLVAAVLLIAAVVSARQAPPRPGGDEPS